MAKNLIEGTEVHRVLEALRERHGGRLQDESFQVECRLEGSTVVSTITLARRDRSFVYEMAAALDSEDRRIRSVDEAVELTLDFLDWYLGEFFKAERDLLLPLDWQPHRFGDYEVLARGDVRNEVLDAAADAWLRGERQGLE